MRQSLQLAITNLKRMTRLQPLTLGILLLGYIITIFSALIIMGFAEGERVWTWEKLGGDPKDLYMIGFDASDDASTGIDGPKVVELLTTIPDITRIFAFVRSFPNNSTVKTEKISLSGFAYAKSPQWPSLEWGRYFTENELAGIHYVSIAGQDVSSIQKAGTEYIEAFGEQWRLVGRIARNSPRTGKSLGALNNVLIVPLPTFANIVSKEAVDVHINIFTQNHLSNKSRDELLHSLSQTAPAYSVSLRRHMESDTETWQNRLVMLGIAICIVGFAIINLLALIKYWIYRRSYEIAVRLVSGASWYGIGKMLFGEQLILISVAFFMSIFIYLSTQIVISHTGLVVASSSVQIGIVGAIAYAVAITTTKLAMREIKRIDIIKMLRGAAM